MTAAHGIVSPALRTQIATQVKVWQGYSRHPPDLEDDPDTMHREGHRRLYE